jgi:general secretion pathway protein I
VRRRRSQRGFTLLEVLVAAAIMGIAVVGVMSGLSASTRNAARITEYDRGAMLARLKMDELLAEDLLPRDTPLNGLFRLNESGGTEAGWSARVTPIDFLGPVPQPDAQVVDRIGLEVWWMDGTTRRTFVLEGIRRGRMPVPQVPGAPTQ